MNQTATAIKLSNCDRFAIVDESDLPNLLPHTWWWHSRYPRAKIGKRHVGMHELILDAGELHVDHINGNTLDNRRSNLRVADAHQNRQNSRKVSVLTTSVYKGVNWCPQPMVWRARISVYGRNIFLGHFKNEEVAARAYDAAAIKYFGEFARVNFPTGNQVGCLQD